MFFKMFSEIDWGNGETSAFFLFFELAYFFLNFSLFMIGFSINLKSNKVSVEYWKPIRVRISIMHQSPMYVDKEFAKVAI